MNVSVVIPVYRSERFIRRTLEAVFAQELPAAEVIVVDDGSPDGTAALLASEPRVSVLRQANRGMAAARNAGLAAARGELLAFLDHDDRWPADKLAWQVAFLRDHPDVAMVGGRSRWVDEAGAELGTYPAAVGEVSREMLRAANHFAGPGGTLMRAAAVRAAGGFDETLHGTDDWDLYLRLAAHGRLVQVDRLALYALQHAGQASRDAARMEAAARTVRARHAAPTPPRAGLASRIGAAVLPRLPEPWASLHLQELKSHLRAGRLAAATRVYAAMRSWRYPAPEGR